MGAICLRRKALIYGPYEPMNVYEAYYDWYLSKRWWTLEDFRNYLESGRSIW